MTFKIIMKNDLDILNFDRYIIHMYLEYFHVKSSIKFLEIFPYIPDQLWIYVDDMTYNLIKTKVPLKPSACRGKDVIFLRWMTFFDIFMRIAFVNTYDPIARFIPKYCDMRTIKIFSPNNEFVRLSIAFSPDLYE